VVAVSVTPETFEKVFFDQAEIIASCSNVLALVPGTADLGNIAVQVDEDRPTNRVRIVSTDPLTFDVHSGAFEDTANPRQFSDLQTQINVGRLLFEAVDRANAGFGAPALDLDLAPEIRGGWDIYCFGRVHRLGLRMHKPRYLYDFHNWVGFSDDAAEVFERLWNAQGLTFADIESEVVPLSPTRTI
jgi:hypothetical protein